MHDALETLNAAHLSRHAFAAEGHKPPSFLAPTKTAIGIADMNMIAADWT